METLDAQLRSFSRRQHVCGWITLEGGSTSRGRFVVVSEFCNPRHRFFVGVVAGALNFNRRRPTSWLPLLSLGIYGVPDAQTLIVPPTSTRKKRPQRSSCDPGQRKLFRAVWIRESIQFHFSVWRSADVDGAILQICKPRR